ncbi:hypothetical protein B296_00000372 [Ensete ventricosum]|uniref:Uncharacterized protein n=1 Tax=Ensete ventricosum TaxID=4639 RepID=A0A427BBQ5_ENSVE|nr:hypothetical protein B296_00000372 [Ensete ventricosum]
MKTIEISTDLANTTRKSQKLKPYRYCNKSIRIKLRRFDGARDRIAAVRFDSIGSRGSRSCVQSALGSFGSLTAYWLGAPCVCVERGTQNSQDVNHLLPRGE